MASEASSSTVTPEVVKSGAGFLSGRRRRILRENLTAYLFLFPAMSLIFIFGLFPVAFSLYVSMYRWRIKQGDYLGLGNYVRAMDDLAYVMAFGLAVGSIFLAGRMAWKLWRYASENGERPWLLAIPGILLGLTALQFIRFFTLALPEVLAIGDRVRRIERTREIFVQFFREAFQVEAVAAAQQLMWWLALATLVALVATWFVTKVRYRLKYINWFFLISFFGITGYLIGVFTLENIQLAYAEAQADGEAIEIWTHIILVSLGVIFLYASWRFWQASATSDSSQGMVFKALASVGLLVGAWMLIAEIPPIIEAGDDEMWGGLARTAWFSFGTVPLQLALGLAIAYLLYQNIKAKSFFRMVYFLPYITPAVAAAAVFRVIFSNRPSGMMNQVWTFMGLEPQGWLLEPNSVFNIFGISGPSLAMVVIILFSVWTYAGYNAVIFLAGLGGIPASLYEAAEIDGATRWQVFRHITIPLLSPITYFLSLLGVIGTFKAFNSVYVLRNAAALDTVDTMSLVIWDQLKVDNRYGYAATLAFVLFAVVLVLTLVNNSVQGKRVFYG
jgi:multiple sugar transport system permease protein